MSDQNDIPGATRHFWWKLAEAYFDLYVFGAKCFIAGGLLVGSVVYWWLR